MLTLFQVMTFDNWNILFRDVVVHSMIAAPFLFVFIGVGGLVLMNLVTAVIVEQALSVAKEDEALQARVRQMEAARATEDLVDLFLDVDLDGNGTLTKEELLEAVSTNPTIQQKLAILELADTEADTLFDLLDDDGGGAISPEEFSEGLRRMKGPALSKDIFMLDLRVKRIEDMMHANTWMNAVRDEAAKSVTEVEQKLDGILKALRALSGPSQSRGPLYGANGNLCSNGKLASF